MLLKEVTLTSFKMSVVDSYSEGEWDILGTFHLTDGYDAFTWMEKSNLV